MSQETVPQPTDQIPPGWVKVCRSCGQAKSYDAFHACPTTADRCRHDCKACRNRYYQQQRQEKRVAAGLPARGKPGPRRPPVAARPPIPWTTATVAPAQLFRCAALQQLIQAAA